MPDNPTVEELLTDLRLLRTKGLVRLRHTDLVYLSQAAVRFSARQQSVGDGHDADLSGHQIIEIMLKKAIDSLGTGELCAAAISTFGLSSDTRDKPASYRRIRAARVYHISVERFRKYHERIVMEQVAEQILKLLTPVDVTPEPVRDGSEPMRAARFHGRIDGVDLRVVVSVEKVEMLSGVDILVVPTNPYFELPQSYKSSVSAAVRRAAAIRAADGHLTDVVADEIEAWKRGGARPGLPAALGAVIPTSAGAMSRQSIHRLYHVAIATPRAGSNNYVVEPIAIIDGVRNILALARQEQDEYNPPLRSIAFPLLGSGRGGLSTARSFTWLWTALRREIAQLGLWELHFFTTVSEAAEFMRARITEDGLNPVTIIRPNNDQLLP
jgi:hypothetical protein